MAEDSAKNYLMLGMIAIILIVSVVQAFQINSIKNELKGSPAIGTALLSSASTSSASNSGAETNEQMMARMHPDQVQQTAATQASSSQPSMVGGC